MKIFSRLASLLLAAVFTTSANLDGANAIVSYGNSSELPVFFFHGSNTNTINAVNYRANLTAEGRTFVSLDFCTDSCSITTGLQEQAWMGAAQVREVIASAPDLFEDGYIFIAHSNGGSIAKFVIEEMDDHKVKTFVSLAGSSNGRFYGPQEGDDISLAAFMTSFALQIPSYVFNMSEYSTNTTKWRGEFQRDLMEAVLSYPELQHNVTIFNQLRSPYEEPWIKVNRAFPIYHNLIDCNEQGDSAAECLVNQTRYKENFQRVENVHLFSSPNDYTQAPYQTGLYGSYSTVDSYDAIVDDFESLKVLDMTETREYLEDTYGLKTMNENGQIHRYLVPEVLHVCWAVDYTLYNITCEWAPIYDKYIYPLLFSNSEINKQVEVGV